MRNSEVIFIERLYLYIFPPRLCLFPLVTSDYYDGSEMNGTVSAQWTRHLKQVGKHCWLAGRLTHSPDVSLMVIIPVVGAAHVTV